jgi:hypothetical protein
MDSGSKVWFKSWVDDRPTKIIHTNNSELMKCLPLFIKGEVYDVKEKRTNWTYGDYRGDIVAIHPSKENPHLYIWVDTKCFSTTRPIRRVLPEWF